MGIFVGCRDLVLHGFLLLFKTLGMVRVLGKTMPSVLGLTWPLVSSTLCL
jgi:hypothetical protein